MSDWIWICALIVVAYAISKATDTIVYVAALRYSYLREVRHRAPSPSCLAHAGTATTRRMSNARDRTA